MSEHHRRLERMEGRVTATGRVTKPGKTLFFVDSAMTGEDGEEVGRGRGSFTRSTMPLDDIALHR